MSSDLLVWRPGVMKDGVCKLKSLTGVSDDFEIHDGVSRLSGWPDSASAAMDPNFPKDIGFSDSLFGTGFVLVSPKAKDFLTSQGVGQPEKVEYLPIKIVNHKGRTEPNEYFIVNPLDVVDCIDEDASEVELDSIDKGMISGCEQLVLRQDAIPPHLKMFRLGRWSELILIRSALAKAMKAAGLTAMRFIEPAEYDGLA